MKYLILFFLAVASVAVAEDVDAFLRRAAVADLTKADFHQTFSGTYFKGTQVIPVKSDVILPMLEAIKASGAKFTLESFSIVAKTETPMDAGAGTLISVISKCSVKMGKDPKATETTSHDILFQSKDGKLQYLSTVARTP